MSVAKHFDAPEPPKVILRTQAFQDLIDRLSSEMSLPRSEVAEEVAGCLDEMSVVPSATNTSQMIWRNLSSWMSRAYRIDVDDAGLSDLSQLSKQASLIFLPNHKSYLDPIFLRATLSAARFPANYVLGGDNLAFWPMASLARRNGIVFIRREFKEALIYKATLRAYLGYLLNRHANLEWYIEGGRSRTGKLRPPRYGILSYVVDAFQNAADESAYCVPVSITYDQQHEVGAISAEELGASKSPESVKWLVHYARDQSRTLGRVHIRFGEPLSLRDALDNARKVEEEKAREKQVSTVDLDRYAVPKIAFEVSYRINKVTPITPTSLVTFALLDNDDRALTIDEGRAVLEPLLDYIAVRNLPLTSDVDTGSNGGIMRSLRRLIREGVVDRYDGGYEPVYSINRDRMHEAGFYRNSIAHHFLIRAMVEVALVKVGGDNTEDAERDGWKEVKKLEDLLKYEFFFPSRYELAREVAAEIDLAVPDWRTAKWNAARVEEELTSAPLHVAHRTIGPFLEAYEVVAILLAKRNPSRPLDRNDFITECIGVARQWWYQGLLHSPESISKNLFSGALKLADNRGLLDSKDPDIIAKRQAFAEELTDAVRHVQIIRDIANKREGLNKGVPQ